VGNCVSRVKKIDQRAVDPDHVLTATTSAKIGQKTAQDQGSGPDNPPPPPPPLSSPLAISPSGGRAAAPPQLRDKEPQPAAWTQHPGAFRRPRGRRCVRAPARGTRRTRAARGTAATRGARPAAAAAAAAAGATETNTPRQQQRRYRRRQRPQRRRQRRLAAPSHLDVCEARPTRALPSPRWAASAWPLSPPASGMV